MAAWKVHIHSGDFSFSFVHRKGDSGMGMITPIWEEPVEELPRPRTRLTLFLYEGDRQRELIEKQLRELKGALLLFLRKIRRVEVAFYGDDGQPTSSTSLGIQDAARVNHVMIKQTSITGTADAIHTQQFYHVTKHKVRNLPRSENREYSRAEESSKGFETSTIVLAFALTRDSAPVIEPQDVFAFLPTRRMGFNVGSQSTCTI